MDQTVEVMLESWRRQAQIVANIAERVDDSTKTATPAEGETDIAGHLCHIHGTRRFWLSRVSERHLQESNRLYTQQGDDWIPMTDLTVIREELAKSAKSVESAVREHLEAGTTSVGGYDHPVFFLQHMIWHEGWHVGLIMLALRRAGQEPPEEWEEPNIWGLWRTE